MATKAVLPSKPWYSSKTIWIGIAAILITAWNAAAANFTLPSIPEFIYALLGAFGIYTRVAAKTVIE